MEQNTPTYIYNFEIYTCNPTTGETGWEIEFPDIEAQSLAEAKEKLKSYPNFDCIILFNYRRLKG